jgi:hypothetical protein
MEIQSSSECPSTGKVFNAFKLAYGLLDYPTIVKTPMDLGTVQIKLNNGQYLYVEDMIDDIQLIWDNCKLYNSPGSVLI